MPSFDFQFSIMDAQAGNSGQFHDLGFHTHELAFIPPEKAEVFAA